MILRNNPEENMLDRRFATYICVTCKCSQHEMLYFTFCLSNRYQNNRFSQGQLKEGWTGEDSWSLTISMFHGKTRPLMEQLLRWDFLKCTERAHFRDSSTWEIHLQHHTSASYYRQIVELRMALWGVINVDNFICF